MSIRFIIYLSLIAIILIYGLIRIKKINPPFKFLVLLIGLTLLSECISRLYGFYYKTTFPVYHFYIPFAILLNSFIYLKLLDFNSKIQSSIQGVTLLFITLSILNTYFLQTINTFSSYGIILHGFQTLLLSLILFFKMLQEPSETPLRKQAVFWFNTGNFVFYGMTFTIFALYNFYYQTVKMSSWVYLVIWFGNIFLYSTYFIAIYLNSKEMK